MSTITLLHEQNTNNNFKQYEGVLLLKNMTVIVGRQEIIHEGGMFSDVDGTTVYRKD